jgi:tripartite-type tricarboxylate transporter receptor subunit TctC
MRRWLLAACACALTFAGAVSAQVYPVKPVRLIVPFPPGGGFDAIGRPVAERLGSLLGQPMVVENRAGASGNIGAVAAARSAPDGYTLLLGNDFLALNAALSASPGYDAVADFAAVSLLGTVPTVMAVSPALAARDLRELLALSRKKPLNFGSPAPGSVGHLLGELMNLDGSVRLVHVPYKGSAPAVTDVIGGHLDAVITTLPSVAEQIRAGKLRGIGVFGAARPVSMPELHTIAESGGIAETGDVWYGVFVRSGTPAAVIRRLNEACVEALREPALIEALQKAGFEPASSTPHTLSARLKGDIQKWARVAKAATIERQ